MPKLASYAWLELFLILSRNMGYLKMIELLNNYRAAKEASNSAARELGRAFGTTFEKAKRDVEEFKTLEVKLTEAPKVENLAAKFPGTWFDRAFRGCLQAPDGTWTVGFHNQTLSHVEGSTVVLDEAPFVEGFIEGFNESRKEWNQ